MVQLTNEQLQSRSQATTAYLNAPGSGDILAGARAYVNSLNLPEGDQGAVSSALSNYAITHYLTSGKNEPGRGGTEGLQTTGTEINTNLAFVPKLTFSRGPERIEEGTGQLVRDLIINPVEGTFDASTPNFTSTDGDGSGDGGSGDGGSGDGGSGDGGGSDNNAGGGSDNNAGGGSDNNAGGVMSLPTGALNPVTSLIGTPGAGQTGTQATLMGQTAGLATDIAGVRGVVNPIGEQVTALQSAVTPLAAGVTNLGTNVGTSAEGTGLYAPISTLQTGVTDMASEIGTRADGQPNLLAGQQALTDNVGTINTNIGTPISADTPQTLFAGQGIMQDRIGQQAVRNAEGTQITPATGLFEGQSGLMSGQGNIQADISGLSTNLTDESLDIQNRIRDFSNASQDYQNTATAKRGDIANTAIANQTALMNNVSGAGAEANTAVRLIDQQRQDEAAQFAAAQAPLQQQIANLTANNNAQGNANQQIGALGPMAADPRDALIQQLLTRNASLMNNRPV